MLIRVFKKLNKCFDSYTRTSSIPKMKYSYKILFYKDY